MNGVHRYLVAGKLRALSPVAVGAGGEEEQIDIPVVRDGMGRPLIPGTSLAGALGFLLSECGASKEEIGKWLGSDDATVNSALIVDDAPAVDDAVRRVRSQTALNSKKGVAEPGSLHSRENLKKGTTFDLQLELSTPADQADEAKQFIAEVINLLEEGIAIGAATSRGLGEVVLASKKVSLVDLGTKAGLLDYLTNSDGIAVKLPDAKLSSANKKLSITIGFTPGNPLMSSVVLPARVLDRIPLAEEGPNADVQLVLPGSGIKGALRARAGYLLATTGENVDAHGGFNYLFGSATTFTEDGEPRGGRGRLRVHETYSSASIPSKDWEALQRLVVAPPPADEKYGERKQRVSEPRKEVVKVLKSIEKDGGPKFVIADRVAIDRWLGGAAEHLLFCLLEPRVSNKWEPILLELTLHDSTNSQVVREAMSLLVSVLDELNDGWIPFGFGTRRGLGAIQVDKVSIEVGKDLLSEDLIERLQAHQNWGELRAQLLEAFSTSQPDAFSTSQPEES